MRVTVEVNDVADCDVDVESELTETDTVNDPVCDEVVETLWALEVTEAVVAVVGSVLTMSTMWIVLVTIRVSVRRSVVGGEAT